MTRAIIMTPQDIKRSLTRIAHEIAERNEGVEKLLFIGMRTRGVPLASRLAAILEEHKGVRIPVGSLDIGPYRDDLPEHKRQPTVPHTDIPSSIDGKSVVLVDDVLYTGRSIRAAMDALIDRGRPGSVQLAVLVDRGHRELPIRADYVGKNIPSARHEEIRVRLVETDGLDEVVIVRSSQDEVGRRSVDDGLVRKEQR